MKVSDCIIVGGGLIGMLSAQALLKQGLSVSIFDSGPFGREASWAGGGILSPLYPWRYLHVVSALAQRSQQLYPSLVRDIIEHTDIDPEWWRCGMLILGTTDQKLALSWAKDNEQALSVLSPSSLAQIEPALSKVIGPVLSMPEVAQVRNPRFICALQKYLQLKNVNLFPEKEIAKINHQKGVATGVTDIDGTVYSCEKIIIANGAWSSRLLAQTQINLPIRPVHGQMLLLKGPPNLIKSIILQDNHYLIPRLDGHIVVGSTIEDTGFKKILTQDAKQGLWQFASNLISNIEDFTIIKHWSGLRPGCGQGIPYIGEHPDIKNVFINAGHYRNGIVMAPSSAELVAQLCLRQKTTLDFTAYSLHINRQQWSIGS